MDNYIRKLNNKKIILRCKLKKVKEDICDTEIENKDLFNLISELGDYAFKESLYGNSNNDYKKALHILTKENKINIKIIDNHQLLINHKSSIVNNINFINNRVKFLNQIKSGELRKRFNTDKDYKEGKDNFLKTIDKFLNKFN